MTRYDVEDLKKLSVEEIQKKYGVSKEAVIHARNRRGIYLKKKKILITTPYEQRVVAGVQKVAEQLGLSVQSVRSALRGNRVATLEDLEIKLEVYHAEEETE